MEPANEANPKRKYVMTPERLASLMARLEKARRVPKEIRYRKTEKRYNANIRNLGAANAKRREKAEQEQAELRSGMERLFPPPAYTPEPVPPLDQMPGDPPRVMPPGFNRDNFEEAQKLIRKRLRKVQGGERREARRLMRVLEEAIAKPKPLSQEEAMKLVADIMACLEPSRVGKEAQKLNDRIAELLGRMIETRYGPRAQFNGTPFMTWLAQIREDARARGRRPRRKRESGVGSRESQRNSGFGIRGSGLAEKNPPTQSSSATPDSGLPTPAFARLPTPVTEEDWRRILARALGMEGPEGATLVERIARAIWVRLRRWTWQAGTDASKLKWGFEVLGAKPVDSAKELGRRWHGLAFMLELGEEFWAVLKQQTKTVEWQLGNWLRERRSGGFTPPPVPGKSPAGAGSDQPTARENGSATA